jgi:phage terminase large subunit
VIPVPAPGNKLVVQYKPNDKQILFHQCGAQEAVYGGAKGGGKAEPLDAKIPTPDGWTTMGDIEVGDFVFGDNGVPKKVLWTTDVMYGHKCYKLVFDDGTEVVCDEDHLWHTYTANDLAKLVRRTVLEAPTGGIRTTKEIAETLYAPGKQVKKNHAIMATGALVLPEKELAIDPYVLGVWLGDGSTNSSIIATADQEILDSLTSAGHEVVKNKADYLYRVTGLITDLKAIGVAGNKHVPMEYKRASKDQRLAILQGLMDTDGYARPHGGVEFTTTLYNFALDVQELIVSLGWKASIREGRASYNGKVTGPKYRIVFTPDEIVFRLKRKATNQKLPTSKVKRAKHRFIVSCEPIDSVPVKCIKVEGNEMYLTSRSMIPTHNTCAMVMEALAYGMEYAGATIYIFRETFDDLEANIVAEWKKRVPPELYVYHETKHIATLYNGTKYFFRYVKDKRDAEQYDGRSIDAIFVDELTKHEETTIQQLLSCLRSPLGFPARFRASCNPGGIGHSWVKKKYILPTDKGKKTYIDDISGSEIAFIPATVYDNEAIMMNDPQYVRRLENLPPKKKQAFLHGDWDMYDGQAFEEFAEEIHVVKPFEIPDHWYRWRSVDNGHTDPFAWYWFAVDEAGFVYIYREFTREKKDPKLTYSQQAAKVLELSSRLSVQGGVPMRIMEPVGVTYCGHDAFATHPMAPGKSIAYFYQKAGVVPIQKSIPDRTLRKAVWHEYLQPFEYEGKTAAKVRIFDTCEKLIETLPQLSEDEKDPEKYAECGFDHWADGAGYGLVSYHLNKSQALVTQRPHSLPWPLRTEEDQYIEATDPYAGW